jgi:lipopolysaccharide biosynthesis glycosyltransferase
MTAPSALSALVVAIDDTYTKPLRTLIRSIGAVHGEATSQLRMIVLDQGLTAASRTAILAEAHAANLTATLRPAPAPDLRYPLPAHHSRAKYTRLCIPEVIDDEERVLYMDADTLVLSDLRPLLDLPMSGHFLGAVRSALVPLAGYRGLGRGMGLLPDSLELGFPHDRQYFNSGVLLIDLAAAEHDGLFKAARRFLTEHPDKALYRDQDALNHAADDHWLRLEPRWNTIVISHHISRPGFVHHAEDVNPLAGLLADEHTAAILHFAGPGKPWQPSCPPGRPRELYRAFQPCDSST